MFAGIFMTITNTSANSLLQATAPARIRGQTVSLYMLVMRGGVSIGSLLTGISVHQLGSAMRWRSTVPSLSWRTCLSGDVGSARN
jgi:MFS family permease